MVEAVLFKSENRFESFKKKLEDYDVNVTVLDFDQQEWIDFDYSKIDCIIYFPSFEYTSNHPQSLYKAQNNLTHIHGLYPAIKMFPDPNIIHYYSDKYQQFLFLKNKQYPIPETIPLFNKESVIEAEKRLGYPLIVKNRFGAGGDYVYRVENRKELEKLFKISVWDFFNFGAALYLLKQVTRRLFLYYLIRERRMAYPFISPPMLAQKFVAHDHDLKMVVGNGKVVEGHWRFQATRSMWKMNIDGGGIGQWSHISDEAIQLSERLAKDLNASWLNIDFIESDNKFLISEFSPVWHHYKYKEKPSFVYKDDYNIDMPLEIALDLERIIVESLLETGSFQK